MAKKEAENSNEDVAPHFEEVSSEDLEEPETKTEGSSIEPAADSAGTAPADVVVGKAKTSRFSRFKQWYGSHKKVSIPLTIVAILAVLLAVPYTRYLLVGTVWRQNFTVKVLDSETNKPVSSATVKINGKDTVTNGQGEATLKLNAGPAKLHIEKKYYQTSDSSVLVPIFKQKQSQKIQLKATGRQVTITVVNRVNKKAIQEATVTAFDTKAKTDKNGQAILVVPADKQSASATIEASGYNKTTAKVTVTTDEKANKAELTPSGQVYFLSNASGKIDVVKSNLDGTDRKVVLAGTGKEDSNRTILVASRDWKYLALLSRRDGGDNAKVFLIDTSNDNLTAMDEGDASFDFTGWSGHTFVYSVSRLNKKPWETNTAAIKSFDAATKKLTTLDQFGGEGDQYNYVYSSPYTQILLTSELVYVKNWGSNNTAVSSALRNKKQELRSVKPDGSNNHLISSYDVFPNGQNVPTYVYARLYEPKGIWVKSVEDKTEEYENGTLKQISNVSMNSFLNTQYPTYLLSPNGNMTFWEVQRDGKNLLSVGDSDGKNAKEVAKASPYSVYGWFTDDYLLVSKEGSELYIMPVNGGDPVKISDYYKVVKLNYGGGY